MEAIVSRFDPDTFGFRDITVTIEEGEAICEKPCPLDMQHGNHREATPEGVICTLVTLKGRTPGFQRIPPDVEHFPLCAFPDEGTIYQSS